MYRCILKPLFKASVLILLNAKPRLGLRCVLKLMNCEYRPMHQRYRKFKTCKKLACMQTMGGGGSESTDGITFHHYISSKD